MSVIIMGMEMPKLYKTYKIRFTETNDGKIVVGIADLDSTAYRPAGEAVPVPPHGRLIDADAMQDEWFRLNFDRKISDGTLAYWNYQISNMPTIIPAEENE